MVPGRLLDLTRSLRRAGRLPTGVDRVERAYLEHLLLEDVPLFALVRTPLGYLLLDTSGARAFHGCLQGNTPWPTPSLLSRIRKSSDRSVAAAETTIRQNAIARCLPSGLPKMLGRHLPGGFCYYNVGHSNLTDRVLGAVKSAGGEINVLIHDVIPLDHPEFQRAGTVDLFRDKVARVGRMADRIIYNSNDTRERTEARLRRQGSVPAAVVAHLGTTVPEPDFTVLPKGLPPKQPYFVTVGTIEPRKNHSFLLDLWDKMGPDAPPLLICGNRGWNNEDVFKRLDSQPPDGPIKELPNLSDGAIAALVSQSAGALFPTCAEGFGLPPIESLSLGMRVLCNDLAVFEEVLGNAPCFVPVSDSHSWLKQIKTWENTPSPAGKTPRFVGPTWADHFNTVLRLK